MCVDPLAESYAYQSPYNFCENRVIDGRELEGLERVPVNGSGYANALSDWMDTTFKGVRNAWNNARATVIEWANSADEAVTGTPEKSNEDIGVSLRTKNGGGDNPTTTGSADEHWNVDGFFEAAAASGGAKTGNKYKSTKDFITFFKDINSGIKKSSKATGAIIDATNSNSNEQTNTASDTTITVPNNTLYSIPHGTTGYLQKTRNGTTEVTVPNNQSSIDSARAAANQSEKEKDRLVNESINNLPE